MKIKITEEKFAFIAKQCESTYPNECCGILFGKFEDGIKFIYEVIPMRNQNVESPQNRYLIPPDEILKSERHAQENGFDILGYFHSHPDKKARPSEFDREHAWPWYSYVIVSVMNGNAEGIGSWQLAEDRSRFHPEELIFSKIEKSFAEED
jgi:proteasome lid subunit RPN8/RPN11